jgi:NADH pyrophosphatase NudC (nudix superfamily)
MKTFCINCGTKHTQEEFPKKCSHCAHEMYINPLPVSVVVIPVINEGVLLVKRAIPPFIGEWALVGGFVDKGETAPEAAIREAMEEAGVKIETVELLEVQSSPNRRHILLFYKSNPIHLSDIKFTPNSEVSAIQFTKEPIQLAFPIHAEILKKFFTNQGT